MVKLYPCTCKRYGCNRGSITVAGTVQPGKWVTSAVRKVHQNGAGPTRKNRRRNWSLSSRPNREDSASASGTDLQDSEEEDNSDPLHAPDHPPGDAGDPDAAPPTEDMSQGVSLVIQLCSMLAMWLHVQANVSRDTVNTVLKGLRLIIATVVDVVQISLTAQGVTAHLPVFDIPVDIRTIHSRFNLDPKINRTICCPKCYRLYSGPLEDIPRRCTFKQSRRARPCNAELRRRRRTRTGVKEVPHTQFSTQDFDSWLEFFLSQRSIEESLASAINRDPLLPGSEIHDLRDTPAWADLGDYLSSKYNLVFGLYIDWFNPYTNKIAGKVVSCGAVALCCLNLPPELRYKRENIFIVGLIPSPSHPDAITLPHVLDPIVEKILSYDSPGKPVKTYSHPEGVHTQARIIPLIADLLAARQAAGFLSHAAHKYCWYCHLTSDKNHRLDHHRWTLRTADQVRRDAQDWLSSTTIAARNAKATKTGVRWSSLHRLPYWDPVKHTILGYMHNWLEGILKFQLRTVWGIGRTTQKEIELLKVQDLETYNEADREETESEASDLQQDDPYADPLQLEELRRSMSATSQDSASTPRQQAVSDAGSDADADMEDVESDPAISTPRATPNPSATGDGDSDEDENDWEDSDSEVDNDDLAEYTGTAVFGNFKLSKSVLEKIRTCIREVSLPTWVTRLPENLGEKKHGKLKADQYLTLFSAILPLVIPELELVDDPATNEQMLNGFYHLVAATNIASSFTTSDAEADEYTEHVVAWRRNTQNTYPDVKEPPNTHYALHYGEQMKYWGSGPALSEFWGERLNGDLQKIKTNRRLTDMDFTMLRQMSRRCRLLALLRHHDFKDPILRSLAHILDPDSAKAADDTNELDETALADYLGRVPRMSNSEYKLILNYLNDLNEGYISWRDLADLDHRSMILPPNAKRLREYHENGKTYSHQESHSDNGHIQFRIPNSNEPPTTGVIHTILEIPLHGFIRKFILVRRHKPLDLTCTPYATRPGFMSSVVAVEPYKTLTVIEPQHVITHLSSWVRPARTYSGIHQKFRVVCWALARGRK